MKKTLILSTLMASSLSTAAAAEIVEAKSDRYVLKQEATSSMSAEDLWARLIKPETWWHPDHTYSGRSENLSLDLQAGGLWREDWDGGSVSHGTVIYVKPGSTLRMNAPFGPLQEMAVNVVWTITLTSTEDGTKVTFDEIANGTEGAALDKLAPAVDFVKTEAIKRLTQ
ncbi:SRPBCC domain-containing protein [Kordiimonas sp. SCSIO 12603]|uniref:SRPBCC family protein n=1 Tax=Kordiimonas sp. SCSIO 12603 TaxID=2829596 RepID=UPI0021044EA9|nr:SRPBCC domain-containing protein [Kordiimonas sp. SCSIO 12603]UTW59222.1 SRPBCC domain-containing protein [Kordiimonas sp. SCSIO 12603]